MVGLRESGASASSAPQPSTTDLHAASLAAGEFGRASAELIADLADLASCQWPLNPPLMWAAKLPHFVA
ncbi:hypothetical protein [Paracraurococcus ruber]|uniref:Uncharacterized protein n=1 Tax=Paracraurococcus ruber TaxID=77675 RepID=A0ABS1CTL1_9PROT|nr:hypothetical protein [Paracraurococcus ruber]MBK1657807.1 hypothetical protein [Paracraurococcus ruber]TDG09385.1 hypothetical protein E2C05_31235 [Paracraurococcus ruber]